MLRLQQKPNGITHLAVILFTILLAFTMLSSCAKETKEGTTTSSGVTPPKMKMTTPIPESVSTPDKVETSIGTMNFFDGVPTTETVEMSFDFLDKMNAVKVFQAMLPSMSVNELRE